MRGANRLEFWWVKTLAARQPHRTGRRRGRTSRTARWSEPSRCAQAMTDTRGLPMKPGVYTLRFAAAAAGRRPHGRVTVSASSCSLRRPADDQTPDAAGFKGAVALAKKTLGKSHPATLSLTPEPPNETREAHDSHAPDDRSRRPMAVSCPRRRHQGEAAPVRLSFAGMTLVGHRVTNTDAAPRPRRARHGRQTHRRDIALALAARGADVALCYRRIARRRRKRRRDAVVKLGRRGAADPGRPPCTGGLPARRRGDRHRARAARRSRQHGVGLRAESRISSSPTRTGTRSLGGRSASRSSVRAGGRAAHARGRRRADRQLHRLGRREPAARATPGTCRTTSRRWGSSRLTEALALELAPRPHPRQCHRAGPHHPT